MTILDNNELTTEEQMAAVDIIINPYELSETLVSKIRAIVATTEHDAATLVMLMMNANLENFWAALETSLEENQGRPIMGWTDYDVETVVKHIQTNYCDFKKFKKAVHNDMCEQIEGNGRSENTLVRLLLHHDDPEYWNFIEEFIIESFELGGYYNPSQISKMPRDPDAYWATH